jgi:hypothetical protein
MEVYHEFLTALTAADIDNICLHSGPNSMRVELFENPVTVVEMEGMPKLHYELVGVHTEEVEGEEVEVKDYIIHALDTDFLRWTAKQVIAAQAPATEEQPAQPAQPEQQQPTDQNPSSDPQE